MDRFLQQVWYERRAPWLAVLLVPLSWLFRLLMEARHAAYRYGVLRTVRVTRPVLVVGNITVGGSGKTPLTLWLADRLQAMGVRAGIVLRGYGGRSTHWPRDVTPDTAWEEVGDEAMLLATRTAALVVAGPDRIAAANRAIDLGAQIILSDDGLQHYRLARDVEIVAIDEYRGLGNGRLLPAGPLRELPERLRTVNLTVLTRRSNRASFALSLPRSVISTARLGEAVSLKTGERRKLPSFADRPIHAVAAIGNPQAFFDGLAAVGLSVQPHPLPDHAHLRREDIVFADDAPVLMTEKDAVKCRAIADERHWAVRMDVAMSTKDEQTVIDLLERLVGASGGLKQ